MKLYTKIGTVPSNLIQRFFLKNLDECEFEQDDIFYYDRHDLSVRSVTFDDFIDEVHWNHIINTPTTKILINYSDDYFNMVDIERFSKTILEKNINPSQVYFLGMDKNFENFARDTFKKFGIDGINVSYQNFLMKKTNFEYVENLFIDGVKMKNSNKFSTFSRNYHPWRLSIFLELLKRDNIKYFDYTFHNIHPYNNITFTIDELKEDISNLGYEIDDTINNWLNSVPYDIGGSQNKWKVDIDDTIYKNDFHLIIESHYDPYLYRIYSGFKDQYSVEEFSPAFITEKTWKAIACKKPFLMASVPYSLKDLRKMGYKTFSPFIDESYDEVEDNDLRMRLVLNEIERICNLNEDDYNKLKLNCESITEHNFNLLKYDFNKIHFSDEFNFLIDVAII
jgi:hypothetical protein